MDCNTSRLLLPFLAPAELDADEAAALQAHLAACPACAAHARAEAAFDDQIGRAVRDVPVPDGLRGQIMTRLAVERGQVVRKHLLRATAAVAAGLLILGFAGWQLTRKVELSADALVVLEDSYHADMYNTPGIEQFFRSHGVKVQMPPDFDPDLLVGYDVVEFEGRRAARLDFQRNEARAKVYVLSAKEFRVKKGSDVAAPGSRCSVEVVEVGELIYVIVYQADATRQHFRGRNVEVG